MSEYSEQLNGRAIRCRGALSFARELNVLRNTIQFVTTSTFTNSGASLPIQRSAAAERNQQPILEALQQTLPASCRILEIASGTGQHAAFFASRMPHWMWQPSDLSADGFDSVSAWCVRLRASNVQPPLVLDVMAPSWPVEFGPSAMDAIYCANMLHIAPWPTCGALMRGAARYLAANGALVTYGPYLEQGVVISQSNIDFDVSLRQRNPAWGIRALEEVVSEAERAGLRLAQRIQMPANNLLLVFTRL